MALGQVCEVATGVRSRHGKYGVGTGGGGRVRGRHAGCADTGGVRRRRASPGDPTRTGSISLDRTARYRALDQILTEYAPLMRHSYPGLAYVRPAVFAYRDGHDDFGDRWATEALAASHGAFRSDTWGLSMLGWHGAGATGRARMRALRNTARGGVYRGLATAARVVLG